MDANYNYISDFWFDGNLPIFQGIASKFNSLIKTLKYYSNSSSGFAPFVNQPLTNPNFTIPIKVPFLNNLANNGSYFWKITLKLTAVEKSYSNCNTFCEKILEFKIPIKRMTIIDPTNLNNNIPSINLNDNTRTKR